MRGSDATIRWLLGALGLVAVGAGSGVALASYTTSGTFDFYASRSPERWQPARVDTRGAELADLVGSDPPPAYGAAVADQ